jgi:hypothetical protein
MHMNYDLSKLLEQNTIVFENIPDLDGSTKNPDGTPRVWRVRPLTVEREHRAEAARLKNTDYLQRLISQNTKRWKAVEEGTVGGGEDGADEEDLDPRATAEQWAPIVAAVVCEPELDEDDLIANFHGVILRFVGEKAEAFFRDGPAKETENRAMRRAK